MDGVGIEQGAGGGDVLPPPTGLGTNKGRGPLEEPSPRS
jgi:hypothetical protein